MPEIVGGLTGSPVRSSRELFAPDSPSSRMDVSEAIATRLELKEYSDEPVDDRTTRAILEAGRQAPSGRNLQHWRFILVREEERLRDLAAASPSGRWIDDADFAVAICIDTTDDRLREQDPYIDAGRALTYMQLTAWELGVASRIFTVSEAPVSELLAVPASYDLPLVAGFGHPNREVRGIKDRKPLEEIAFSESFGEPLDLGE